MAIELNDLPAVGRRVWGAIVPPVSHVVAVLLLLWFVIGFDAMPGSARVDPSRLMPAQDVRLALEFYGFSNVAPLFLVVLLLAVAHGLQNGLIWSGSRMPPYLTSNTTVQMRTAADGWTLQRIWGAHPEFDAVQSLNMLNVATDEAVMQAELDPKAHHRFRQAVHLRERAAFHRSQLDFVKGLVLTASLTATIAAILLRETAVLGRFALVLLLAGSWWFYHSTRLVETEHAYYRAKVQTYLDVQEISSARPLVPHVTDSERDRERLRELSLWMDRMPMWEVQWSIGDETVVGRKQVWAAIKAGLRRGLSARRSLRTHTAKESNLSRQSRDAG